MRKNPHVRICGGLGSATTLVYPTHTPPGFLTSGCESVQLCVRPSTDHAPLPAAPSVVEARVVVGAVEAER